MLIPSAEEALQILMQGNARFRAGQPKAHCYEQGDLEELAKQQKPLAAIVACSDSRVSPEIVFDQPLGTIFASRVPGNVASDSAKWMLEIAIGEFEVPLVMVMGHTGCLAVGQLLDGDKGGAGGAHRYAVLTAVYRAKALNPTDVYRKSIEENAKQTIEQLSRDLYPLRKAILSKKTSCVASVYNMKTGEVDLLAVADPATL